MTYELVMPFVTVESAGGPHEDVAFVAGYQCGWLDAALQQPSTMEITRHVHADCVRQVDLLAMRHGFDLTVMEADDEWALLRLRRVKP